MNASRCHSTHDVRKFQIESQRHPRGRDADDVPCATEQLALERELRRLATAVRIEDLGLDPCRFKHAGKPPDAERRSQKSEFAAVRIVRTDQQCEGESEVDLRARPMVFFSCRLNILCNKCRVSQKKYIG